MISNSEEFLEKLQESIDQPELNRYLSEFSEYFNQVVNQLVLERLKNGKFDPGDLARHFNFLEQFNRSASVDPSRLLTQQIDYLQQQTRLWQRTALSLFGGEAGDEVVKAERGDSRFSGGDWSSNPLYTHLKQAYLLNVQFLRDVTEGMQFSDPKVKQQAQFWVRQLSNAMAPTNFAATNPEVCRAIVESKGKTLYEGLQRFLHDLQESPDNALSIAMCDDKTFRLGDNIAATPGQVVFQNTLMQLIQYEPQTETAHRRPLLLVPAFINKYYILDLSPQNSLTDWLVKQGFTVFTISWVNPGPEHAGIGFDDYLLLGPVAARRVITEITGEEEVNALGYCVGGALLACAQAWLKARGEPAFHSTTFLATLLDYSLPGELGVFVSEEYLQALEQEGAAGGKGFVDGRLIRLVFSLLRENNLYWSFFINNYLMGRDPAPFDLLYWNSDATNLPLGMGVFYLRNMYQHNRLVEPGGITLADTPIDLGRIDTPAYFLATMADHIALWEGCYRGVKRLGGDVRFTLAASGHIAGVINPPAEGGLDGGKYGYWSNLDLPGEGADWLQAATEQQGSWWPDWLAWLLPLAGEPVPARRPGSADHPVLEPAPGSYATAPAPR